MSDHGIRISSKGNSALKQANKFVSYSSKFSTPKIYKKGAISVTTDGGGSGQAKVLHGLNYAPSFYVFRKGTADFSYLDATTYSNSYFPIPGTSNPWITFSKTSDVWTDKTYLNIYIEGDNSTTYDFVYYVFIDETEFNDSSGLTTTKDSGFKVGVDPAGDSFKEQNLQIGSEYGTLKYSSSMTYDVPGMTLPALSGDFFDTEPAEGTFIDIFHGLGYTPFFLAYSTHSLSSSIKLSNPEVTFQLMFGNADYAVCGWADKERIRLTYYRKAHYSSVSDSFSTSFAEDTVTIRLYVFLENMDLLK